MRMPKKFLIAAAAITMPILATTASPIRVEMATLALHSSEYLGEHVVVDACIVNVQPHGIFIQPCQNKDWRKIMGILDPNNVYDPAFSKAYYGKSFACGMTVKAGITGKIVMFSGKSPWNQDVNKPYFSILAIQDPQPLPCPAAKHLTGQSSGRLPAARVRAGYLKR